MPLLSNLCGPESAYHDHWKFCRIATFSRSINSMYMLSVKPKCNMLNLHYFLGLC